MYRGQFRIIEGGSGSVEQKKSSLRAYMKRRRGENENRDVKENGLVENFFSTRAMEKESFFVYLSYSSEAPTDKLISRLLKAGKTVYAPRVEGRDMEAVLFGEDFTLSERGIREPVGQAYRGKIDVAVLPLLAADERGGRLGYGGGYYDRFLRAHPETLAVAYCFDFQLVREVPCEPHDKRADWIVTDKRIIEVRGV